MVPDRWHLAQINVGRFLASPDDPRIQPFMDALDRINAVAEASPGFVWRLQDDNGNATAIRPTADPLLAINMSVWRDADSLFDYVYRSTHTPVMARRRDYFERFEGVYQALWWIEAGTLPTIDDGLARLWRIDRYGSTPQAFTFKARFPSPDVAGPPVDHQPDPWCVGHA